MPKTKRIKNLEQQHPAKTSLPLLKQVEQPLEEQKQEHAISPSPLPQSTPLDFSSHTKKSHRLRGFLLAILALIGFGLIGFGAYAYTLTKNQITDKQDQKNFFQQVRRIVDEDVEPLKGEKEDQITVALFGIGGEDHPGGTLTDTIMIASIKPSTNQVALISIPRDLQVPYYAESDTKKKYPEYYKINEAYYYGGIELAIEKAEIVTGLDIHYYVLADFTGFRDLINNVGGLDVYVDNAFTDRSYPDYNYGYQVVSFQEGQQHMDGEKALQYARSRKGNNGEGSDYRRAARQQKILEAFKEKVLSGSTLLNPIKITEMLQTLGDHISTNAEIWEMSQFATIAGKIEKNKMTNQVIQEGADGLVYGDRANNGAFVIIPNAGLGDFSEIHAMVQSVFTDAVSQQPETTPIESPDTHLVQQEQALVAIQNGSSIEGLASQTSQELQTLGVEVQSVGNAPSRTEDTIIYDLSNGTKSATLAAIQHTIGGNIARATWPSENSAVRLSSDLDSHLVNLSTLSKEVQFIVVLGKDAGATQ
ncbi:MAG TPA: LCP family protein [Patescibacteria group bacterium]|nr:LCP family protein [Patescibacteria group bacterium]